MKATSAGLAALCLSGSSLAGTVTVNYGFASGQNANASARAVWTLTGTTLTIEMQNTSAFNSLVFAAGGGWSLASINFALPTFSTFDMAGAKSVTGGTPLNQDLTPGNGYTGTAAQNWAFQNGQPSGSTPNYSTFRQVITTLEGDTSASSLRYQAPTGTPSRPMMNGPSGGIFPSLASAGGLHGFSGTLTFSNTLTAGLTDAQFRAVVMGSAVTFNSHGSFVVPVVVPLPAGAYGGMAMFAGLLGLARLRHRKHAAV